MIFVTVGTHEQQFNRLIEEVDRLKGEGIIAEEVIIQTGYSTYEPQYCQWKQLFSYEEMIKYVSDARIVITHGGPSSFIMPLQIGKVPIVVPRQKKFGEHVNDHQVEFAQKVVERMNDIILVQDITQLDKVILDYDEVISRIKHCIENNNTIFCERFSKIINDNF